MNNEIKSLWVSALRSGEYTKTTGVLCKNDLTTGELCFCALGVLCNLWHNTVGKDAGSRGWQHASCKTIYEMEERTGSLPQAVCEWAGLQQTDPIVVWKDAFGERRVDSVSDLNDSYSLTFPEIAAMIERNL